MLVAARSFVLGLGLAASFVLMACGGDGEDAASEKSLGNDQQLTDSSAEGPNARKDDVDATTGGPDAATAPAEPRFFTNPVMGFNCPDPGVMRVKNESGALKFYSVCTGGKFRVRTSDDLVSWRDAKPGGNFVFILPDGKPSWADNGGRNWAPEIHQAGDKFLAYYTSVNGSDVLSIGVASAPSPLGPWTDKGAPLVQDGKGVIDATFYEDDDGSRWLFYKIDGNAFGQATPIYVRKLAADGLSFAPGSTQKQTITNNAATWEGGVVEAPWVVKHGEYYFMFYSGNVYNHLYRTSVARAKSLTGPWEKKGGEPLLKNNREWVGPGHGSVVRVGGLDYFVYHAWHNRGDGLAVEDLGRNVLVDRITWGKDNWPKIGDGSPTIGKQPYPGQP